MPQSKIFGIVVTIAILIGVVALLNKSSAIRPVPQSQESTVSSATSSGVSIDVSKSSANSSYTVSVIPTAPSAPAPSASSSPPSLSKDVVFSGSVSADIRGILNDRIAKLRATLSNNYNNFGAWMNLAIQYKTAGDYDAAREVWEYTSRVFPRNAISPHNLGDLYQHFLTDYAKAEEYYKRAISVDPTQSMNYLALHDLYRYSYRQDTSAAVDILKSGITKVSGNQAIDLYAMLGSYYQDRNDRVNASAYYTKARDAAQKIGDTALVEQLDVTLAELKQ